MSRPTTPPDELNGNKTPGTPYAGSFSLTEYSAHPSPPREGRNGDGDGDGDGEEKQSYCVPEEFLLPNGTPDYLRLILTSRVYEVVNETPLTPATNLSNRLECRVLLKREDLQPVFSFKLRGAYNKMANLPQDVRWKGVVACSAGNHAQGVAFSARHLKIPATIIMPLGTPAIKHTNVSRLGGHVVLHGSNFDAAKAEAAAHASRHGLIQIPPFDDPYVIAGQGTIGLEILRQTNLPTLEAVFCAVGGGGLIAGVGVYIKRIAPHVKVIGVETHDANALVESLRVGRRVVLDDVGLFADGAAVRTVGAETFRVCRAVVDDVVLVSTDETCAAIKDVFEDTRSILEPAGALALAGLKKYVAMHPRERRHKGLVAVASGANMNFDRLRFVAERAALGERKEALLTVTIPERPGAFARLIDAVHPFSVTEFSYRHSHPARAHVLLGIEFPSTARRDADLSSVVARVLAREEGGALEVQDLSGDEVAKSHVRYLVGGTGSGVAGERVFMFEFPERGGALFRFLRTLQPGYNISLFHYRNYGGDVGRVMAGIEAPMEGEGRGRLEGFLRKLGYPFTEVTGSRVYRMFLRGEQGEEVLGEGQSEGEGLEDGKGVGNKHENGAGVGKDQTSERNLVDMVADMAVDGEVPLDNAGEGLSLPGN